MKKSKVGIIGVAHGVENVIWKQPQNGMRFLMANANAVSDFTVGMILSEIRNIANAIIK
ncbi:MAG: hypothetical protein ACLVJO_01515 [[Clostridium] scindens]